MKKTQLLYLQVRDMLMDLILGENLKPGDKLPSERQLAKQFGCNYQTVRRSFAILQDERLVERRVGSGTYLLSPKPTRQASTMIPRSSTSLPVKSNLQARPQVGVIVSSDMSEFDRELLRHIHNRASTRGYRLTIRPIHDFCTQISETAHELLELGCVFILLPRVLPSLSPVLLKETICELNIPIILAHSIRGLEQYCYEKPEIYGHPTLMATKAMCRYLKTLGYKHIAFFGGNIPGEADLQRQVMAYSCFVTSEGMQTILLLPEEDGPGCPNTAQVEQLIKQWSHLAGDLAVICWGDEYALRLMMAIHKSGLRIPEDIAVLGSGDIPLAKTFDPPLSTIRFDYDYVANALLNHGEAMKHGESAQACGNPNILLIARDSCGGKLRAGENLPQIINDVTHSENKTEIKFESENDRLMNILPGTLANA